MSKSPDAFRTISEVADWLDTPAHVLRFWESRFSQVKPVKRAGGRRYYRPNDMLLLGGIKRLLHQDGLTVKDVQKLLREKGAKHVAALSTFDLSDGENTISSTQAIEVEAESSSQDTPMFTSIAPRKEAPEPKDEPGDPDDQMSFPGFEFTSDRSKTFETPAPTAVTPEPAPSSIDIRHIPALDLSDRASDTIGALARLSALGRGDLDEHTDNVVQVRAQLSAILSDRASTSNS